MSKRERLREAREEGTVYEFLINEVGSKKSYKLERYEFVRNSDETYKLIYTAKALYHHNDTILIEGSLEECALYLAEKLS